MGLLSVTPTSDRPGGGRSLGYSPRRNERPRRDEGASRRDNAQIAAETAEAWMASVSEALLSRLIEKDLQAAPEAPQPEAAGRDAIDRLAGEATAAYEELAVDVEDMEP